MAIREILGTHPRPTGLDLDVVARCIEACYDCEAACASCADADLAEPDVQEMVRCIRLCLDCADVCETTGRVVTRQSEADLGLVRSVVGACVVACVVCREECEKHAAHHEHCRICVEVCRRCEDACNELIAAVG
jgi:hypothetical protein